MTEHYAAAGVSLAAAEEAKRRIAELVASTRTPLTIGRAGAFAGMVRVPTDVPRPALVMSTDGVGTKVLVAARAGIHNTIGEDLVNHSVNDILVHGARPIAFMDYVATGQLDPPVAGALVEGVARACRTHDMTLAGGETAELPDLYQPGHYDLAGTIVGVVDEAHALLGDRVRPGDLIIGLASTGLHTNGYTLARRIVFDILKLDVTDPFPDVEGTVQDVLLAVHRSYYALLAPLLSRVHALAHVTGGGIAGNLIRVLPEGCDALIDSGGWPWPPLFRVLARAGGVSLAEMRRVFNLGIGMIVVVPVDTVDAVRKAAEAAGIGTWLIGEIRGGPRGVRFSSR